MEIEIFLIRIIEFFLPAPRGGVRGRVQKGAWGVRESAGGCKGVQKVLERERQFFLFLMLQD